MVSGKSGAQVYTLSGADRSYRSLLDGLSEGAILLSREGTILYCNDRFREMIQRKGGRLVGTYFERLFGAQDRARFKGTIPKTGKTYHRDEFSLRVPGGTHVTVIVSTRRIALDGMILYCVVVTDISERKRMEKALEGRQRVLQGLFEKTTRMRDDMQGLSRALLKAQEAERARISREIHDEIGQALAAIGVAVAGLAQGRTQSRMTKGIRSIQKIVEKTANYIHHLSRDIHPAMLEELGLFPTVRALVQELSESTGMKIDVRMTGTDPADAEQKVALYRIMQESLTNILKHSGSLSAQVTIRTSREGITMMIVDTGKGFKNEQPADRTASTRMGIMGMKERAMALGGECTIDSQPGQGTVVRVHLPSSVRAARRQMGRSA